MIIDLIPIIMVSACVLMFALAAWLMERPARPKRDWGEIIASMKTAPWDGATFEHPGTSYAGVGRHRRR